MKRVWVEVPDWVDEEMVRKRVKEIAYTFSYVPVEHLRNKFGISELKEEIDVNDHVSSIREKEKKRIID
ncbi:MAG: hypothetical protein NXY59_08925 [Aigarchaeota archaeon]|nr:hypothetical protein [Candidatus Pelearchaeum maunauluense]